MVVLFLHHRTLLIAIISSSSTVGESDSPKQIWFRYGRFAIGRTHYRPFIALPEPVARWASIGSKYIDWVAYTLLFVGGVPLLARVAGYPVPIEIGLAVWIARVGVVIFGVSVISKTIIDHQIVAVTEREAVTAQEFSRTDTECLSITASVEDSTISIGVRNLFDPQTGSIELVDITSESGKITINDKDQGTTVGVASFDYEASLFQDLELERFDIDEMEVGLHPVERLPAGFEDTLKIALLVKIKSGIRGDKTEEIQMTLPVTVSENQEIISGKVEEEISYELLDDAN
jgi:hypothetical protein